MGIALWALRVATGTGAAMIEGEISVSANFTDTGVAPIGTSRMSRVLPTFAAIIAPLLVSSAIQAQETAVRRGRLFAESHCARCHEIGRGGESPLPKAPPFGTLHLRYPVEDLAEALAEGIRTAHPAMPQFELGEDQIRDLIAYLKTLEH